MNERVLSEILSAIESEAAKPRNLQQVIELLDRSRPLLFDYFRARVDSDTAAKAITLKVENVCMAKYHTAAQSAVVLSRPYGLTVDPTNFCNLQCPGCVHSPTAAYKFNWEKGNLGLDRFAAFMEHYGPYATHITLCNWGEPTLNRQTPEIIKLSKKYLVRTMLSTNLSVGRFDAEAYVESGLDFMVMSIDGATDDVYRQYRRNGNLGIVYDNIRNLVDAKRRLGRKTPVLNWQFLVFEHNEHEIPMAIEMAREMDIDMVTVFGATDVSWDDPAIRATREPYRTEHFNTEGGVGIHENWNAFPLELETSVIEREFDKTWADKLAGVDPALVYEPDTPSEHTCRWLYTNMTLDAKQRVMPCCGPPSRKIDIDFGTFDATSEVYNSPKYRVSRMHFAGAPRPAAVTPTLQVLEKVPHCLDCNWNQDRPNVRGAHLEQYLSAVPGQAVDAESIRMLCSW